MNDIGVFAARAAELFVRSQQGIPERWSLGLAAPTIEAFVKTVYYASMISDEGRWPSASLMSYPKGSEKNFHFLFDPPRTPTPKEVAKLAHAVAPASHICCLCDRGEIEIGGFHVTILNDLRELGYSDLRVGNPLRLVIRGPGHVEMSTGGTPLVYNAGHITEEELLRQSRAIEALLPRVERELSELTSGVVESLEHIFNGLVRAIARLGHGGMLIVDGEPKAGEFSLLRRIDCTLLQDLLLRYWNDVALLNTDVGGPANLLSDEARRAASRHSLAVSTDTSMLEKCVGTIAHLAGVDGAIVLDYSCRVVAFNAITAKKGDPVSPPRLVDGHDRPVHREAVVGNRGSRHQAGLAYAMRVPHSFVFAISQDGGVTAFHNPADGTVVCEPGLRVLD